MKTLWNRLTLLSQYYIISMVGLIVGWSLLSLIELDFINTVFFMTAYVWHFALVTPGLREKVLIHNHKFSFLSVAVRINYYLQLFINIKKIPFSTSLVRALSPCIFTFLLFIFGGSGNLLFTLLGSFCFECIYLSTRRFTKGFIPLGDIAFQEIPPVIPNEENSLEHSQNPHSHQIDYEKKI